MRLDGLINRAWAASSYTARRLFERTLRDPEAAQLAQLSRYVSSGAVTAFGRRYGFASIDSVERFRRRIPLSTYDDYRPWIERIRRGERRVLTADAVQRFVPSSGSTAACKRVPYTATLRREFRRAIGPWISSLFGGRPDLQDGPAYWSISPATDAQDEPDFAVPFGFEEDTAYLGAALGRWVDRVLAVPSVVRHIADVEAFRYATLLFLLHARSLRVISIWHPSFLALLLESLETHWSALLSDVERGGLTPPRPVGPAVSRDLERRLRPAPARADELGRLGPSQPERLWPRLGLISCWGDAHAQAALAGMVTRFPGVDVQRKGLLATEAVVSFPFEGAWPVAVRSHFFEFLDDHGHTSLAHELRESYEYTVVVTTGGGLYRYRLGDRVRVEGFIGRTPSLRFIGREDRVSDRCGEKLSDGFVAGVLEAVLRPLDLEVAFAMLAPDDSGPGVTARVGCGYTLYLQSRREPPSDLAARIDRALCENLHYRHCVRLGQLLPARVFRVTGNGNQVYLEACRREGRRLGDIKPTALSRRADWSTILPGVYQEIRVAVPGPEESVASDHA